MALSVPRAGGVTASSGPQEHVCSRALLFWKQDWARVALPLQEAGSSGWYHVPTSGHLGHLYQGAWVGVVIASTMLGHPLNPPKTLSILPQPPAGGTGTACGQSQLLTALPGNRRG